MAINTPKQISATPATAQWAASIVSQDSPTCEESEAPGVKVLDLYYRERDKLHPYIAQLKLYIGFNGWKFPGDQDKTLFGISQLRDTAFNWADPTLIKFLEKDVKGKWADDSFISDYAQYKVEIKKMFSIVNEWEAAEWKLHTLRQDGLAVTYAAEFQWITALTEWEDPSLNSMFYWGLKEAIKDEISRSDRPEELQDLINKAISIDGWMHERQMERKGYQRGWIRPTPRYTEHRYYTDPMDIDVYDKWEWIPVRDRKSRANTGQWYDQARGNSDQRQSQPSKTYGPHNEPETQKCYNCEKPGCLARNCKQPKKRHETKAFVAISHDTLSWTACYDDMCWVHQSDKDSSGWYSQQNKQKRNHKEYNMIDLPMKELNTLEKSVTLDMSTEDGIEETDTQRTQVNDNAWMYVNSDDNSEDIDNWEVEMGAKKHHTHSRNLERERKEHHKREWNAIVQETKEFNWLKEVETIEWNAQQKVQTLNLCDIIWRIKGIASQAWATMAEEQHTIQIKILTGYRTTNKELWTWRGGYVPSEFLKRVRSLESQLQGKYNQYDPQLYSEQCVVKSSKEYVMLLQGKEPQWFKDLWRRETESGKDQLPSQD